MHSIEGKQKEMKHLTIRDKKRTNELRDEYKWWRKKNNRKRKYNMAPNSMNVENKNVRNDKINCRKTVLWWKKNNYFIE